MGGIDPGTYQTVWMIDANAVEVGQQPIHTRGEQLKRRAWHSPVARGTAVASNEVLVGIEHRVAPRLPVGVGAAGRCAHQVVREKEPTTAPDIAVRVADLQVAVKGQSPCPSFCLCRGLAQHRMLPVEDELPEEVLVDLRRAKPPQLRPPLRRPGRQSRRRTMKALIDAAGLQAGPATPVIAAMLGGQRLEVSISLKDVPAPAAEVRELSGQGLDAGSGAAACADLAEAGVQGGEHAAARFPGVGELHAVSGSRGTAVHHGIEEALAQRCPGRIFRQRAERD